MFSDGDVSRVQIHPGPGVVVLDSIAGGEIRLVGVPAENAVGATEFGVVQRPGGNLASKAKPARIQAIELAREGFGWAFDLLDLPINLEADAADEQIATTETIELVAVDRDVALALVAPDVSLVHGHAYQVRHDVGQSLVVIAFNPDDFDFSLWVG